MNRRQVSWRNLFSEAGIRCPRCRSTGCARGHGWWFRKRVTDLSTGEVFVDLPICRVVFCDGSTQSLWPAEVWRGRATITSVVEAMVHTEEEGVESAWEWCRAGTGEEDRVVSRRTLCRWREAVKQRLIPSATSWIRDLKLPASPEDQVKYLLDGLSLADLLSFRTAMGCAMLDKAPRHSGNPVANSSARPVPGRLDSPSPHETPRPRRPRGSWSTRSPRGSPPRPLSGGPKA